MFFKGLDLGSLFSPEWEEDRKAEQETKAIIRLWERTINELEIQHPDPRVRVRLDVEAYDAPSRQVRILFRMFGLRDSSHPDKFIDGSRDGIGGDGFCHSAKPVGWPGFAAARAYLTGVWAAYLMHEAMELVTVRGGSGSAYMVYGLNETRIAKRPVVDPHVTGYHNTLLCSTHDLPKMMDLVLGPGEGAKLIEKDKYYAQRQLESEIRYGR